MTSALLTDALKSLGVLSIFLLLGFFLRAKVPFFQKTFLPASVIGGFILLLLGPIVFNVLPIPEDWVSFWSLLPGILIVPVVTATPLGLGSSNAGGQKSAIKPILPLLFIMIAAYYAQYALGFITNYVFQGSYDLYETFGWELPIGYTGGHGTAAILGQMLQEANLPYWETAQGVAITTATFGIVGGILIGMVLINWAARKGYTAVLDKPGDIPRTTAVGYDTDITSHPSAGRETTSSSSLDTVAFHAAIIFVGCSIAYAILSMTKSLHIPGLDNISVWAYGIIVMFILNSLINKMGLSFLIDAKIKGKITGPFTEFAVIAAIASLPVEAVMSYLIPILFMCLLGYVVTVGLLLLLCKKFLRDAWFETMVATLGMSTGVFLTGLLLLRICDPEFETPALNNYSIAFSILSAITFAMMPVMLNVNLSFGLSTALMFTLGLTVFGLVGAWISAKIVKA
ncbi:glutamate:sodium symporter [Peptoniphilus equinus]|uniref:Glutamate:sodium symporter n=1 Tax=Peptoniphilus equinus TaxID=3016343 RepID=A0ABY7QUG7_9FIRM|nr:sodium/glutamate symporter [Peptoniphilus equinus]WBW49920.1 glutamate:sodium symporter [Peptoniphilus equinus]